MTTFQLIAMGLTTVAAIFLALNLCEYDYKCDLEDLLRRYRGEYLPQREVDGVLR